MSIGPGSSTASNLMRADNFTERWLTECRRTLQTLQDKVCTRLCTVLCDMATTPP